MKNKVKILCMADIKGVVKEDMEHAAKTNFKNAEVSIEVLDDIKDSLLKIETYGPGAIPISSGFYNNHEDAEIIMGAIYCPFSEEIMSMFPNLKVIGTCRGGLENVDMEACRKRGIMVVNGYGRNAEAVSDYTVGLMLSEIRNIARSHKYLTSDPNNDNWRDNWVNLNYIPHMKDATIGIFGFGYIGRLTAQKLSGFKCKILVYDPYVSAEDICAAGCVPVDKETLFKEADILTVHARLVEATKGIIGKKDIESMKPTAFFINTARAGLVDYDALYDALKNKRIGGAGLDVFPEEPLAPGSKWRKLDNCTIAAHYAGGVLAARSFAAELVSENIINAVKGISTPQIITKELLDDPEFRSWADDVKVRMEL